MSMERVTAKSAAGNAGLAASGASPARKTIEQKSGYVVRVDDILVVSEIHKSMFD